MRPDVPVLISKAIASVAHAVEVAGASSQAISQCTSDVAAAIERALSAPRVRCIDLLARDPSARLVSALDLELLQADAEVDSDPLPPCIGGGSALVCDISTPKAPCTMLSSSPCRGVPSPVPLEVCLEAAEADAGAGTPLGADDGCLPGLSEPHVRREAWTSCRSLGSTKPEHCRTPSPPQAETWLTAGAAASASVRPLVETLEPVANGHTTASLSVVKAADELLRRCWLFELAALGASSPDSAIPTLEELLLDFERWRTVAGHSVAVTT